MIMKLRIALCEPPATPESQGVAAIDPANGKIQWKFELTRNSLAAGVLYRFALPE